MKIFLVASLLFITGFNITPENVNMSMPGAYKMLYQSVKGEKLDNTSTTLQQLKIYTDGYMMYANFNPQDSSSSFGIGTYSTNNNGVVENVIYSASGADKNENPASFKLVIEKTGKGYKQIIPDMQMQDQKITLTEEYESVGTGAKSPLDGAWKETRGYSQMGNETKVSNITQFKTYYAGHVIWGHNYTDSVNKTHTGIGFGAFKMTGNNKLKESMMVSNYEEVRGKDFDIDIKMNGSNEFTQTIYYKDGSKSVEVYQRLKK